MSDESGNNAAHIEMELQEPKRAIRGEVGVFAGNERGVTYINRERQIGQSLDTLLEPRRVLFVWGVRSPVNRPKRVSSFAGLGGLVWGKIKK